MKTRTDTSTIVESMLLGPSIRNNIMLIFVCALVISIFESVVPHSFEMVEQFNAAEVIKDTLKNLAIVTSFGFVLSFASRVAAGYWESRKLSVATLTRPLSQNELWPFVFSDMLRITSFSLLIMILSRISIHFGTNPVPITAQTLGVLLTGAVLGSRLGSLTIFFYLTQGSSGMHVFSDGGMGLFWNLATGGYLVGFVGTAFLVGFLVERGWNNGTKLLLAMLAGNIILYIPGLINLALFVGWDKTLGYGLYPFIPGDLAKLYVAALIVPVVWSVAKTRTLELPLWK